MNLPNKISFTRILMVPVFMLFIIQLPNISLFNGYNTFIMNYGNYFAGVFFIIASITDRIDGHIARKRNLVTRFGKFLDPIADKLLVTAAVLVLVQSHQLNGWFAMIIIGRELIVTGFRLIASGEGVVIEANILGKAKMVVQSIAITVMLFEPKIEKYYIWGTQYKPGEILMVIAVIITVVSGYVYIRNNIKIINSDM